MIAAADGDSLEFAEGEKERVYPKVEREPKRRQGASRKPPRRKSGLHTRDRRRPGSVPVVVSSRAPIGPESSQS